MTESSQYQDDMATDKAVFTLLASFYNTNPDEAYMRTLLELDYEAIKDPEIKDSIQKITSCASLALKNESMMLDIKRDWTKLFRGVAPSYGPKPPYEQLYNKANDKVLSELAEAYEIGGYDGFRSLHNRHDYIGAQLEYLSVLAGSGQFCPDADGVCPEYQNVSDEFISEHIASWFGMFYKNAQEHVSTDMYRGALMLTYLSIYK